jgi:hypothetical protein
MTFEEFFKKKKIDLVALNAAEPTLFDELKLHFELMGEKSFDHTKKYLFNPLRLKYHTPEEPKVEKAIAEAPANTAAPSPNTTEAAPAKMGFKPKFKMGVTAATTDQPTSGVPLLTPEPEKPTEAPAPTLGFKPKFKAGVTQPSKTTETKPSQEPDLTTETPAPTLGFKPKFRTPAPKSVEEPAPVPDKTEQTDQTLSAPTELPGKPLGFKPRFKSEASKPSAHEAEGKQPDAD